jgi:hypothetical protein
MNRPTRASAVIAGASPLLGRAWATLGLPLAVKPIDERSDGLVDPEALLLATLALPEAVRTSLELDIAAWAARFEHLIGRARLGFLWSRLPDHRRAAVTASAGAGPLRCLPAALLEAIGAAESRDPGLAAAVAARRDRIAGPARVCASAIMLRNRLLFGPGARADIAAVAGALAGGSSGKLLARLAATSEATVSRIVRDLRACGYLDDFRRSVFHEGIPNGLFVSADTPGNISEVVDASLFGDEALERDALSRLDTRYDGLLRGAMGSGRSAPGP